MAKKEMQLKVGEIPSNAQSDIGIGIVRLDTRKMNEIGVREGDIVEVEGKRKTGAIAIRPYPSDTGVDVIRMDGYMRRNAGTSIGENVTIRKAEILEAKKVTIAPAEKGVLLQVQGDQIKRMLLGRVVMKGDIIAPATRRSRRVFPFGDIGDLFGGLNINMEDMFSFGFGEMHFTVVDTNPKGIIKITDLTDVDVLSQAVEVKEEEAALPVITYEDIGGLRDEVKKVREMIELPLKHPELFERVGIEPPKGVLLYGPPGTGKTLLARAVASESGANFIAINGPEVTSKWYGESEKKIREIFEQAQKNAPSIIFIDEIDSIAPKREEVTGEVERRMVAQLLASLDGLQSRGQVIVIAATNRPNALDPAIRRPGRLDREIELGVPDAKGRKEILDIHTRNMPTSHWDLHVVGKTLTDDMNDFETKAGEKIKEDEAGIKDAGEKIKETETELKETDAQRKVLESEVERLKREKRKEEEKSTTTQLAVAKIRSIIDQITHKENELEIIARRMDILDKTARKKHDEINNLQNQIGKFKKDRVTVKKDLELVEKDKELLDALIKDISEGHERIQKRGDGDIRSIFVKAEVSEKESAVKKIEEELYNTGIISDDYIYRVERKSVEKLKKDIANRTYGFVGADLAALAREAAMSALRKLLPEINLDEKIPPEKLKTLRVRKDDFDVALNSVEPSAMREVLVDIPKVTWDDIGGLEKAKEELKEAVEWPLKYPDAFEKMGITPPKGILLFGPPGTGKTLLAKAVANQSEANFISIKGPELISKWVGESAKHIREVFKRARQAAPAIIFLDEIDSLAPKRSEHLTEETDQVVTQLLTEMDGLESLKGVVVIGATNRPDMLDPALLRSGRLERHISIPIPDEMTRKKIFEVHTTGMPIQKEEKESIIDTLVKETEGFVGADIEMLCKEAAIATIRPISEKIENKIKELKGSISEEEKEKMLLEEVTNARVSKEAFEAALKKVKASVSKEDILAFNKKVEKTNIRTTPQELSYVG